MRMAGRHGNSKVTVENLRIVKVKKENNQIFLKGAIPGAKDGIVVISK
jgi:large subunit ribosomal protein L3